MFFRHFKNTEQKSRKIIIHYNYECLKKTINNIYQTCQITKQNIALIVLMCAHNIAIVVNGKRERERPRYRRGGLKQTIGENKMSKPQHDIYYMFNN